MQNRISGYFIVFLIILIILLLLFSFHHSPHLWGAIFDRHESIEFTALVFLATTALAIIAFVELTWSNKITENKFLLSISNKWGSESVIRARRELHSLFVNTYRSDENKRKCKSCQLKIAMSHVSQNIFEMREKTGTEGEKFIDLLNLLDFMEIVGFFWKRKNIRTEDIDGLFGNSILFFYQSFDSFIKNRQRYEKNYYINFCELSQELQKTANENICSCNK